MSQVRISNYACTLSGHSSSIRIEIGKLTVWFSYQTPIAFSIGGELTIRVNDWSQTTGKHLNLIDADKSLRISGEEFQSKLDKVTDRIEL